ncbi:MAG: hypothetical protein R3E08_12205 [Thiotrichaceae bacterium]
MQQLGYAVAWHSYPMQHNVIASEIVDISHWLQQCLLLVYGQLGVN